MYQAALPLSSRTLTFTTRFIRAHRAAIWSRWRVLDPGSQALLTHRIHAPGQRGRR